MKRSLMILSSVALTVGLCFSNVFAFDATKRVMQPGIGSTVKGIVSTVKDPRLIGPSVVSAVAVDNPDFIGNPDFIDNPNFIDNPDLIDNPDFVDNPDLLLP